MELHCCKRGATPRLVLLHGAMTGRTLYIYGRIKMLVTLSENEKSRSRESCHMPSKLFIRANRCIAGSVDECRLNLTGTSKSSAIHAKLVTTATPLQPTPLHSRSYQDFCVKQLLSPNWKQCAFSLQGQHTLHASLSSQ